MSFKCISLDFKLHCIFCGETCFLKSDPCNPSRWRSAYFCMTASRGIGLSFKDSILETCNRQKDTWASQVEVRLQGAVSDLHVAEARYHNSCRKNFMLFKSKQANACASTNTDSAFEACGRHHRTFSDVYESMVVKDATKQSLLNCRSTSIVFPSSGLSSLLVFRDTDPSVFKVLEGNNDDETEYQ